MNFKKYEEEENKRRISEEPSASVFLLSEKKNSERSQGLLKSKEVLKLYKDNQKVDLDSIDKEKLKESQTSGVLVNKKQY